MKISAKQLQKGMKIQVSEILDMKRNFEYNAYRAEHNTDKEKEKYKKWLSENKTLSVLRGAVKKNSPIYTILDIHFADSNKLYYNGAYTDNEIWLITDKGNLRISTRQSVNLI